MNPRHYFNTNPPKIKSYFFRLLFRRFLKESNLLKNHLAKIEDKIKVNSKIIEEIYLICKKEDYPLLLVLFYSRNGSFWQEKFIKDKLQELHIPYIDTRDFLLKYAHQYKINFSDFYGGGGHHNNLGNKVISEGLLDYLSQSYGLN